MKQFFACLLALMLGVGDSAPAQNQSAAGAGGVAPNNAPSAAPSPNTLLDGTAVKLRLAENLTSATAKTGQSVSFEVTEDVVVGGVTVLVKGGQAVATVT
jgi:hypothetical protein